MESLAVQKKRVCENKCSSVLSVRMQKMRPPKWPVNSSYFGLHEYRLGQASRQIKCPHKCPHPSACVRAGVQKMRVCEKTRSTRSPVRMRKQPVLKWTVEPGDIGPRHSAGDALTRRSSRSQSRSTRSYVRVYSAEAMGKVFWPTGCLYADT